MNVALCMIACQRNDFPPLAEQNKLNFNARRIRFMLRGLRLPRPDATGAQEQKNT
jgi:hypothetical protein